MVYGDGRGEPWINRSTDIRSVDTGGSLYASIYSMNKTLQRAKTALYWHVTLYGILLATPIV